MRKLVFLPFLNWNFKTKTIQAWKTAKKGVKHVWSKPHPFGVSKSRFKYQMIKDLCNIGHNTTI